MLSQTTACGYCNIMVVLPGSFWVVPEDLLNASAKSITGDTIDYYKYDMQSESRTPSPPMQAPYFDTPKFEPCNPSSQDVFTTGGPTSFPGPLSQPCGSGSKNHSATPSSVSSTIKGRITYATHSPSGYSLPFPEVPKESLDRAFKLWTPPPLKRLLDDSPDYTSPYQRSHWSYWYFDSEDLGLDC